MKVGIVSKWFNRGQPVVGRQLRSALDELGHESFVLARPKKERGPRPGALDRDDVWDQPGVTEASAFEVPLAEYEAWVESNGIEAVLCDQNYQFSELAALRRGGVRTIGRFVWEHFAPEHVAGAREAYDVVYSLTRCEQERYRGFGLETPYVTWGCHPELLAVAERVRSDASTPRRSRGSGIPAYEAQSGAYLDRPSTHNAPADASRLRHRREAHVESSTQRPASAPPRSVSERLEGTGPIEAGPTPGHPTPATSAQVSGGDPSLVRFIFPGGFLGHRKPIEPVLEAFSKVENSSVRLLVRAQVERRQLRPVEEAAARDARIELLVEDQPTAKHLELFASCDVCLSPARWEGLGLPLYEAIAFGMPAITNDAPPMNEAVRDGVNGLLVTSHPDGEAKSGIPAVSPDVDALAEAIERLADPGLRAKLSEGALHVRDTERRWERTVEGIGALLDQNGAP